MHAVTVITHGNPISTVAIAGPIFPVEQVNTIPFSITENKLADTGFSHDLKILLLEERVITSMPSSMVVSMPATSQATNPSSHATW